MFIKATIIPFSPMERKRLFTMLLLRELTVSSWLTFPLRRPLDSEKSVPMHGP